MLFYCDQSVTPYVLGPQRYLIFCFNTLMSVVPAYDRRKVEFLNIAYERRGAANSVILVLSALLRFWFNVNYADVQEEEVFFHDALEHFQEIAALQPIETSLQMKEALLSSIRAWKLLPNRR